MDKKCAENLDIFTNMSSDNTHWFWKQIFRLLDTFASLTLHSETPLHSYKCGTADTLKYSYRTVHAHLWVILVYNLLIAILLTDGMLDWSVDSTSRRLAWAKTRESVWQDSNSEHLFGPQEPQQSQSNGNTQGPTHQG